MGDEERDKKPIEHQVHDHSTNWLRSVDMERAIENEALARARAEIRGALLSGHGAAMNPLYAMPPVGLAYAGYGNLALAAAARGDPLVEASLARHAVLRPPGLAAVLGMPGTDGTVLPSSAATVEPTTARNAGITTGSIASTGVAYTQAGNFANRSGITSSRKRPNDTVDPTSANKKEKKGDTDEVRFSEYQAEIWTERFEDLCTFRKKHGHTNVPHSYKENSALSQWVQRQRYQYRLRQEGKRSTLTDERVNLLENAGFVWNSHESVWEERWHELLEYKNKHGNCVVPSNYKPNPQLALWVKRQRRQYKFYKQKEQTSMTPERIAKLEKLGFAWDCRIIQKDKSDNNNTTNSPDVTSKNKPAAADAPSPTMSSTSGPGGEDSSTEEGGNGRTNTTGVAPGAAPRLASTAAAIAAPAATMDAYARFPGGATAAAQLPMLPPGAAAAYHPHYGVIPLAAAASPFLDSRLLMATQHPLVGTAAGAVPLSLLAQHAHGGTPSLPPSYLGHPGAYYPYLP